MKKVKAKKIFGDRPLEVVVESDPETKLPVIVVRPISGKKGQSCSKS